jgi:hypothetical protein
LLGAWPRRTAARVARSLAAVYDDIAALDADTRAAIRARVEALAPTPAPSHLFICPMLDRNAGACLVYEHRPGAQRAHCCARSDPAGAAIELAAWFAAHPEPGARSPEGDRPAR